MRIAKARLREIGIPIQEVQLLYCEAALSTRLGRLSVVAL
jgi:hypothetical protein